MYVERRIQAALQRAVAQFPAVLLTGPRQSGKTTLLRQALGMDHAYVSFDDPFERELARQDPRGFFVRFHPGPVILDEIQYVPEILEYIKLAIDQDRRRYGRFVLTGSQQFELMRGVNESLAGRVAVLDLLPFAYSEIAAITPRELASQLWAGGFPEPVLEPSKRELWISSYLRTYVERDVRQLRNIGDLRAFESFVALVAARHGQTLNMAALSRQLGLSNPTVKDWLSVLEASYLLRLVPPWHRNHGKRVLRSPKLFLLDSALVCALTRQPDGRAALAGPLGGPLLEGWVVSEAAKAFTDRGLRPDLFHWRSHDGLEVDVLAALPGGLQAIEVKATATPRGGHARPMDKLCALLGREARPHGVLVCQAQQRTVLPGGHLVLPWWEFPGWLYDQLGG